MVALAAGLTASALRLGAGEPQTKPAALPAGNWEAARAEALERALDTYFTAPSGSRRVELFEKELQPLEVGLSREDLEVISKAAPPAGERRGETRIWRVPCPWLTENSRGWFNFSMPKGYTPAKAWGLAVVLHGSGTDGDNLPAFYTPHLNDLGYFVLYPTTTNRNNFWSAAAELAHVYRLLEWAGRNYRIDFRRLVISGGSMGGMGTWSHLLARPELWSAGGSVAGHPAALEGEILEKLRGIPFYILHGEKDTKGVSMAPVENVRKAVAELRRRKIECVYVEAAGAGHTPPPECWKALNDWIAKQEPKASSPRPALLPPAGKRSLWQSVHDPMGLEADPVAALIRAGKGKEARALLDERIAKDKEQAGAYLLRALTQVPALSEPLPESLDPKDFKDAQKGWGQGAENAALRDLESALRASAGKGNAPELFEAAARMLLAKVWAKRFAVALASGGTDWVQPYQNYIKEIQAIVTLQPGHAEAGKLMLSVNAKLPKKSGKP